MWKESRKFFKTAVDICKVLGVQGGYIVGMLWETQIDIETIL